MWFAPAVKSICEMDGHACSFLLFSDFVSFHSFLTETVLVILCVPVPDLDAPTDSDGDHDAGPSTEYNHSSSSLFELVEDEQGVTVALLNFLMVLFGLSSMNGPSRRKAITAA